jgi:two-component system chemotaxis response regulator CheY
MMATALVVDDSRAMRMILRKTLEELGFEVREAGNGKEALSVLANEKRPISLGLLDWNMPEMDGFELLRRVRELPEFGSMVIVMVTAETELERISEALDAGANEYVMKPFTKDILVGKLELAGIHL